MTEQNPATAPRGARGVAEPSREQSWTQPSFGKQLYLGDFQLDLIHPPPAADPDLTRRGEEVCAALTAFTDASTDALAIERDARIPDETVAGLAELGAFGIKIPREYGGLGLS